MLVKYHLSDSINAPFEDFVVGLRNILAGMWKLKRRKRSQIEFGLDNKVIIGWEGFIFDVKSFDDDL